MSCQLVSEIEYYSLAMSMERIAIEVVARVWADQLDRLPVLPQAAAL